MLVVVHRRYLGLTRSGQLAFPVLAQGVALHVVGRRLRRVQRMLALAHTLVLPSTSDNGKMSRTPLGFEF